MTLVKRLPGVSAWLGLGLLLAFLPHGALGLITGRVQGTVYRADGSVATGTLLLSWPAFTTSADEAVASGHKTVRIGDDGWVAVSLAPNAGASPDGTYYTAVYHLNDGSTSTEYWVVPSSAAVGLASVRATLMPVAKAVQAVTRQYVDNSVVGITTGFLHSSGGAMSGSLLLAGDPAEDSQAATKRYVDQASSAAVSKTGAAMTGPLTSPMINGKAFAVGGTLQQAINAAGTSGSVEIPANYPGTDNFTNPNNIPIKDLRTSTPSATRLATEWGVKCDGVTDDAAAIQAAFTASYPLNGNQAFSIQFPTGTCLTSTIIWKGQSFFGAGVHLTKFKGMPGQDVFRVPDILSNMADYANVHDFDIVVDSTVDASATAAGGNNTFPDRITGTNGGLAAITPAITPGPMMFTDGYIPLNQPSQFTSNQMLFSYIPRERLIGAPITVNGVGPAGAPLVTTITGLLDPNTVSIAGLSIITGVGSLTGTALVPLTPPWYIGNCAMSFPKHDGDFAGNNAINNWTFNNIFIVNNDHWLGHHTCGMFIQTQSYALNFNNVRIRGFYGGYIEALAPINQNWFGPDTNVYNNLNIDGNTIGLVTYGGGHRTWNNLTIYASANPQALGPMMFGGFGSFNNIYHECYSYNTGENSRWTGGPFNIQGGSLNQCNGATINWMADDSKVNAQVSAMVLGGNRNTFTHTGQFFGSGILSDTGADNTVEGGGYSGSPPAYRRSYANVPMEPLNKLTADFLTAGNSSTPFMNGSDLLTRCADWNFATGTFGIQYGTCIADPTGTEITKGFYRSSGTYNVGTGPALNSMNGKPLYVGDRIPQGPGTWVVQARCTGGSCSQRWVLGSACILSFAQGPLWTIQKCTTDYTNVPLGTVLGFGYDNWTGAGTSIDIAYIGFQPANTDTLNTVYNSLKLALPDGQFLTGVNVGTYFTNTVTSTQDYINAVGNFINGVWSVPGIEKVLTGGYIQVDNEIMSYASISGTSSQIAFTGLVRGQLGTVAVTHNAWTGVALLPIGVRVNGTLVQSCWATGCAFVTPTLGTATATSVAITAPTGTAPMSVVSTTPVANLTLASPSQVPNLPATQITGLAAVAMSGSYASLSDKPGVISSEADISFSATPTFPATANLIYMSLTGNVTSSTLAPGANGQSMTFVLCQDATGSHTFVWPANVRGGMTLGATASKCSSQMFTYVNALPSWVAATSGTTGE